MSTITCPCCKQATETRALWLYDVPAGKLSTELGTVHFLGWKNRAILEALTKARGRPITLGALIEHVYWRGDEPDTAENSMSATISQMRRRLGKIGLNVAGHYGPGPIGYALEYTGGSE